MMDDGKVFVYFGDIYVLDATELGFEGKPLPSFSSEPVTALTAAGNTLWAATSTGNFIEIYPDGRRKSYVDLRPRGECIYYLSNEIRLGMFDVTQPFYVSYIGVATTNVKKNQVGNFLRNFFSLQFFRIVALLILIIFVFGTILWLVERGQNRRQFRPGLIGLFDGLWWSAVTMTTGRIPE